MFRLPVLRQTARQAIPRATRSYSAPVAGVENEFVAEREAIKHHAAKSGELWRKITYVHRFWLLLGLGGGRCARVGGGRARAGLAGGLRRRRLEVDRAAAACSLGSHQRMAGVLNLLVRPA